MVSNSCRKNQARFFKPTALSVSSSFNPVLDLCLRSIVFFPLQPLRGGMRFKMKTSRQEMACDPLPNEPF
jgi:hypothetical protein